MCDDSSELPNPDSPPLLVFGKHVMSFEELRAVIVDRFPLSSTRPKYFASLEEIVVKLRAAKISAELFIHGSCLTERLDPHDLDVAFRFKFTDIERSTDKQREVYDWLAQMPSDGHMLHGAIAILFPDDHPESQQSNAEFSFLVHIWRHGREQAPKGYAMVEV
jgi:hypothetical protein